MWITHPDLGKTCGLFEFTKTIKIDSQKDKKEIFICADTKYRLYINGKFVILGPCKKSEISTFYDRTDIAEYLVKGENKIQVFVWHLPSEQETKDGFYFYSTLKRTAFAALMIEDEDLFTDESWLVSKCGEFTFNFDLPNNLAGGYDIVDYTKYSRNFVKSLVLSPTNYNAPITRCGTVNSWILRERTIPYLTHTKREFLPTDTSKNKFVLTPGFETVGTLHLTLSGEKDSKIKITFAECFYKKDINGELYKDIRDDENGIVTSGQGDYFDTVILDGNIHEYETFSMRAFRFIQIEIFGNAKVENPYYYEIKYPLQNDASFDSSDKDSQNLWDISIRTLNNCMHDSFEDCPYYEQIEYVMDSRLQALFLRQLTPDRKLIKKCIEDFRESVFPDGMIQSRLCAERQIIPGFALHYIYMIHDYMLYDGDKEFIKSLMPTVDGIIEWMDEHIINGVLGALGNWSYLDWVDGWIGGVPSWTEPLSVYNFMYILALENASELASFAGRNGLGKEYKQKIILLRKNSNEIFFDKKQGYYVDYPDGKCSMHGQIWAVLSDCVTGKKAKELLVKTFNDKTLPVCSYSMMYFVFRGLEKVNMYETAYKLLDNWREMIKLHCTTWVENGLDGRSECHGWGSTPIYEFSSKILGVRPGAYGYETVIIDPFIKTNDFAKGIVSTTKGKIFVSWKKEKNIFKIAIKTDLENGTPVLVKMPNNDIINLKSNNQTLLCKI